MTDRFAVVMAKDETSIAVEEAALLVAAHFHPVDVTAQLARLDAMAAECGSNDVNEVCRYLFGELGFTGNQCEYYAPENSCLDVVVEKRVGIPITLSVVLMAVARRCGREMSGIGFPGHFLVRDDETGTYIDAFHGGRLLSIEDCRQLFHRLHGNDVPFSVAYLDPVGPRTIIRRMLNNLIQISIAENDHRSRVIATKLRALLPDASVNERADVARALEASGDFASAAVVLDAVALDAPAAESEGFRSIAKMLRARLN